MRILRWEFSEKFSQFLQWFRSISDKRITFYFTDEHPNPAARGRQAMVEMNRDRAWVYIRRDISSSLAEENAAHELTHFALMEMGYCYPVLIRGHEPLWQHVVSGILSWTSDVLIDRILERFGYNNQEYQNLVWENTMNHLKLYPKESDPGVEEISNALGYFYCYHSTDDEKWKAMKDLYSTEDKQAAATGERIIAIGAGMDFSTREGYCLFLKKLRDELELEEIIGIQNPETGSIE